MRLGGQRGGAAGRRRAAWVIALLVVAALAAGPGGARAEVIGFDDLPAGTVVTDQYAGLGVHVGPSPYAGDAGGALTVEPRAQARSAPNVAALAHDPANDFASSWIRFSREQTQVRFHACRTGAPGIPPNVNFIALDSHLTQVAAGQGIPCVLGGALVPVTVAGRNITWLNVYAQGEGWALDDLEVEADPPPQPPPPPPPPPPPVQETEDFQLEFAGAVPYLSPGSHTIALPPGGTVTRQVVVRRNSTSTGPVRLSVDGLLTSGVRGSVAPDVVSGPGDQTVTLTLTAERDARPAVFRNQAVRGTPLNPFAGQAQRVLLFDLLVQGQLAVRTQGIEITQAVQTREQPTLDPYSGVALVRGKKTVVRVFADYVGVAPAPAAGYPPRPPLSYALHGTDGNGRALPGSPLSPEWSPRPAELSVNDSGLSVDERHSPRSAFVFVLPPQWTRGRLSLTARALSPRPSTEGAILRRPEPPAATVCVQFRCGAAAVRGLGGITFRDPPPARVLSALELLYVLDGKLTGVPAAAPRALEKLLAMSPVPFRFLNGANGLTSVPTYRATRFAPQGAILEAAQQYDEGAGERRGDFVIGLFAWPPGAGFAPGPRVGVGDATPIAGGGADRPATVVAHEVLHLLDPRLGHADSACGGRGGGFPSPEGRLSSVGLDTTPGSGGSSPGDPPYRVIQDTLFYRGYDLMSYCGAAGGGDPVHWISARTWNRLLGAPPAQGTERSVAGQRAMARSAARGSWLVVRARAAAGQTRIAMVQPASTAPPSAPGPSGHVLVARDAAGSEVARVPMSEASADEAAGAEPTTSLWAHVPAAGAHRVEVVLDGQVLDARARTPGAPRVRLLAPRRGARVSGARALTVRWRATDADGDALHASVEYSSDGGRTWREVGGGADTGRARLAPGTLTASTRGRLRVRVDDGFSAAATPARAIVVRPRPPAVTVLEPRAGQRLEAGASLYLRGGAVDDRGRAVPGARLRWYAGGRRVGRGAEVAAVLPPGARALRLVARDRAGREGSATVRVRVRSSAPQFLRLTAPRRLPRTARALRLTVAATRPATLRAGRLRVAVDRSPRRIRVPVRPGGGRLTVRLVLSAGGRSVTQHLVVDRR